MRFLLDTHALLWWHEGRLSDRVRGWLASGESEVHVSTITRLEAAIKQSTGKLRLDGDLRDVVRRAGFSILPVQWRHADAVARLPLHHRDPFDRLLVAQAQMEGLSLVTSDKDIARYPVHVVPAR